MLKRLIAYIAIISYSSNALACQNPVTPLSKGEQAPCAGFLFSPDKERELRLLNEDYKFLLEQTKLYLQQKDLYQKELAATEVIVKKEQEKAELWRQTAMKTTEQYVDLKDKQQTRDWIMLLSGVGLTVLAAWSVGQASKGAK